MLRPTAVISREAAAAAGLKHFFTGKPCAHGHICARFVSSKGCIECTVARTRRLRAEDPDNARELHRAYDAANRAKVNANAKAYRARNRDKANERTRQWVARNKGYVAEYNRSRSEQKNASSRRRRRERMASDPLFALSHVVRTRVGGAFRRTGFGKDSPTAQMLGCSWLELKRHIERQFLKGMTWENRGTAWHVDHILPLAQARSEEELVALCHFTNLRPLWAADNHEKHAKRLHLI